jgi:sirohydrochlorin ferrochelatase
VAYLDHAVPSLRQVLGSVRGPATVVPLLLTAAYHTKVDIPRVLASRPGVAYGDTLGPHPLLMRVLDQRLASASAGSRLTTGVVLAAAGSSDPSAAATISQFAARWRARSGWREVLPAYASAASPTVGESVRTLRARGLRRVVVATYLLAPGYFADRIRCDAHSAGADAVSEALGAAPELAQIVAERYEAARQFRSQAA